MLQSPNAPLVNVGNGDHPNYVPPELCIVLPGQVARKKLSGEQTTEMLRVAARNPAQNATLIVGEGAKLLGLGTTFSDGPVRSSILSYYFRVTSN